MLNIKCVLGSQWEFPSSNLQTSLTIFSYHLFHYPAEISLSLTASAMFRLQAHIRHAPHGENVVFGCLFFFLGDHISWSLSVF